MSDDEQTQENGEAEIPAEDGSEPGEKQLGTDELQDQFGTGRDALGGDPKAGTEGADDPDARTGAVASEDDEPEPQQD